VVLESADVRIVEYSLDDEFEGCAVNKDDSSGKDGGRAVTGLNYFQHLSGIY
jgi:hypothetical protein